MSGLSRQRYRIGDVARLTGLSADTLLLRKAWSTASGKSLGIGQPQLH